MDAERRTNEVQWIDASLVPLVRVKGKYQLAVVVTGPVMSFYMHWNPVLNRTQPCVLHECQGCSDFQPKRPLSYCSSMIYRVANSVSEWRPAILEVPWATGVNLFV
jgi:hypothetical protein